MKHAEPLCDDCCGSEGTKAIQKRIGYPTIRNPPSLKYLNLHVRPHLCIFVEHRYTAFDPMMHRCPNPWEKQSRYQIAMHAWKMKRVFR